MWGGGEAEFFVGAGHGDATAWGAFDVALHDEVGFVDVFEGAGVFVDGDGDGVEADGAAVEFVDEGVEDAFVHFVEAVLVDFEHGECGVGNGCGDDVLGAHLGVVADPAEEVVGDAWGAAGAAGDFDGAFGFDFDVEEFAGAEEDLLEFVDVVVVEAVGDAEATAHGCGEHACAGGGTDEGEGWEVEADGACFWALVDDDVEAEVLHGWVEVFFYVGVEAVDFVDEEDVFFLEVGEEAGEVARAFDLRAAGGVHARADGGGDDIG